MSTAPMANAHRGQCLCGAVTFTVTGPLRDVIFCHCEQCQRTSGHFVAATACAGQDLNIDTDQGLRWFASSDSASRGFCNQCGSSLFWRMHGRDAVSIMAGALDRPTGLVASHHLFAERAGDYYCIESARVGTPESHALIAIETQRRT